MKRSSLLFLPAGLLLVCALAGWWSVAKRESEEAAPPSWREPSPDAAPVLLSSRPLPGEYYGHKPCVAADGDQRVLVVASDIRGESPAGPGFRLVRWRSVNAGQVGKDRWRLTGGALSRLVSGFERSRGDVVGEGAAELAASGLAVDGRAGLRRHR